MGMADRSQRSRLLLQAMKYGFFASMLAIMTTGNGGQLLIHSSAAPNGPLHARPSHSAALRTAPTPAARTTSPAVPASTAPVSAGMRTPLYGSDELLAQSASPQVHAIRALPVVQVTTTGPHAFLEHNSDGTPVTWSPCDPISYVVNADEMPANGLQVLDAAAARVSAATGLRFVSAGFTHQVPKDGPRQLVVGGAYVPVLISWRTGQEYSPLAGEVAGVASPYSIGPFQLGRSEYVSGQVTLDADFYREQAAQEGFGEEQAVLMHELGHLVGLAHVHSTTELMNEDNIGMLNFGPGDLQALAEAGGGRCRF